VNHVGTSLHDCELTSFKISAKEPRLSEKTLGVNINTREVSSFSNQSNTLKYSIILIFYLRGYNINMKNRIVCYTCITGGYDVLKDPAIVPDNIDFICFSDAYIQSSIWKCVPIPEELKYLSTVKQQRIVKICPHRYLSDYDISIWVDGNIAIIGNLNNFILQYDLNICSLYIRKHPSRNNVYDEAKTIITLNKESLDIV
jgi:hypothetical protein